MKFLVLKMGVLYNWQSVIKKTGSWCCGSNYSLKHLLVKSFIASVLKRKAHLKANFECACITMSSLVMSLFSHDFIKTEID